MSVFFQFAGGHRQKTFFFFLNRFPGRKLPIELSSGRATCGRTLRQKPMTMSDNQGFTWSLQRRASLPSGVGKDKLIQNGAITGGQLSAHVRGISSVSGG